MASKFEVIREEPLSPIPALVELEQRLRTEKTRVKEGIQGTSETEYKFKELYGAAEVLIPGKFSGNGRQQVKGEQVKMKFLQHATHLREKDMLWDDEFKIAKFKGNPKYARLHVLTHYCKVMSWKATSDYMSLEPLHLRKCDECPEGVHKCSTDCCCAIADGKKTHGYANLAKRTCEPSGSGCNSQECYSVQKVLPGSYVWFSNCEGVDRSEQFAEKNSKKKVKKKKKKKKEKEEKEEEEKKESKLKSIYGNWSFLLKTRELLAHYQRQIASKGQTVLRCGGTLLYRWEVCYVVIVSYEGDPVHVDVNYPPINPKDAEYSRLFDWSSLLDENGCYIHKEEAEDPKFTPHHKKEDGHSYWDHVAFAFHLPDGKELYIPKGSLDGGGPLKTKHDESTGCHKFRKFGDKAAAAKKCKEDEEQYHTSSEEDDTSSDS